MTLREIMKTNVGPERLEPSLPQETEIHHLRPEAVDEGVVYEVVNELGDKVGELAGSQLAFLVRRAVELDLNELLNAIEDGVVVLDREGRICYENEAYSRIIGVPMRKTIGRDMHVIEPDALLLRVLESGKPDARKWHRIKSVGKYVSMRMFPVWRNGVVAGAFSIFRDVTELNRLGMEVERITQVAEELTSQLDVELSRFQMIGQDPQFRTLLSRAVTAAKTDATVLIRGENGVGKEGFAKLIHQASPRRNRPFITVNCAAIPEALIESELFGYEEGSFTGARKGGKLGKFELAQGGTLFLDEVGDMPLIMQSKLLRVLQGGEIEKVGREENVAVDVRIVAATNQPLEELIEQRRFRADLYYRLNVVPLSIPPLRERQGDILPLAYHFLDRYNERYQKSAVISRGAAQALLSYDWPGNVRQLKTASSRPSFCVVRRRSTRPTFLWARSPDRLRRPSPQIRGNMEPCGKRPSVLRDSCCGQCWSSAAETGMRLPTGWASAGAHFTANGRKLSRDKNGTRDKFDTNKRTDLTQAG